MIAKEYEVIWVDKWYEVSQLDNGVVAIGEPKHGKEVFCYLVKGKECDLLIDTGMGISPIKPVLEKLRNSAKPLIVANSHWHFDHIGGNSFFENVLVPKNPAEIEGIKKGWTKEELEKYDFFKGFRQNGDSTVPANFDPDSFCIPGYRGISPVLEDGYVIDLGDRKIEVVETPGHTLGGVCFFDRSNRLLFTGDMLYEGPLYAFDEESDPDEYLKSLQKLQRKIKNEQVTIHPGHNYVENVCEPNLLHEAINLLKMAKEKRAYDGKSNEFTGAVEYAQPGMSMRPGRGQRRLKIVVDKEYVKWEET